MSEKNSSSDRYVSSSPDEQSEHEGVFRVVDKRQFLNIDNSPTPEDLTVEEKPRYPTFVEELMARVAETERLFEEKKKQIDEEIRRTRERLESDYERRLELEKQKIVLPLLEVLDNLERALSAAPPGDDARGLIAGIEMTVNLFRSKLQNQGVEPLTMLDEPFDPNIGQAIGTVKVSEEERDGVVVEEVLRGYKMGDQLLRAAQVRVGAYEEKQPQ
jgi:molecular chaperone GrpE (heat shock protein)